MAHPTPARTVTAVIIEPDGTARLEHWTPEPDGSVLAHLQAAVGGLVDVVYLTYGSLDLWVHDEGLSLCDPNPAATVIAAANGAPAQPYFGPAVFTGGADPDGRTRSLPLLAAAHLLTMAKSVRADAELTAAVTTRAEAFAAPYR